uniref:Zinc transporter ZIP10 n=1 Tax=Strigamia maritima TaxID=126957 RepID=T1JPG8_STRMM
MRKECLSTNDILNEFGINVTINKEQFINLCPAIVYKLGTSACNDKKATDVAHVPEVTSNMVWLYAAVSVLVISLSGLVVVAIIPVLRGAYYQSLLQFLVALAVGSLIGDALLHLLPHAMSGHDHQECESEGQDHHTHGNEITHNSHCQEENSELDMMVWKGLVAVLGIFVFFMAERLLTVCSTRRKKKLNALSKKILENGNHEAKDEEKLCKQKYNSYSYCYGEVTVDMLKGLNDPVYDESDHHNCLEKSSQTDEAKDSFKQPAEEMKTLNPLKTKIGDGDHFDDGEVTTDSGVIVAKHEHRRHGHSHTHTHTVPTSVSSVACMVIMGDGFHNFSDGLAIGAAFASSITGGVSTAIAVFCHELPHELGDFAILLKSGMTAKQALAYNGLSSILCFLGMVVGVGLGNLAAISPWIFAGAGGMFVYIALVDMVRIEWTYIITGNKNIKSSFSLPDS